LAKGSNPPYQPPSRPPSAGRPPTPPTPRTPSPYRNPANPGGNPGGHGGPGGGNPGGQPNPVPPNPGAMAAPQHPFALKYPKPNRFYGDPSQYRAWLASVNLYFTSYGVQDNGQRVNYTLGLLEGAAAPWRQDYITTHAAAPQTWVQFTAALDQSFAPAQQTHEAEQELRRLRQSGRYIETYISEFAILASQAAIGDNTALRAYFAEGLDPAVRYEAIRHNPNTIDDWKTSARQAWRIVSEQNRYRSSSNTRTFRPVHKKGQRKGKNGRPAPRYTNIYSQPVRPQFQRNEYDMDVDHILQSINEIELDDSEEDEEYNEVEEEEDSEEEIDNINSSRRTPGKANALHHLINNVLTEEQRAALRKGECFFCHKQGHFYRDCAARKTYVRSHGKKPMASKPTPRKTSGRNGGTGSGGKKKNNFKGRSKPVDPYAMVYNFEEDIDEEISDDGNF
jgi:hypothetical protein